MSSSPSSFFFPPPNTLACIKAVITDAKTEWQTLSDHSAAVPMSLCELFSIPPEGRVAATNNYIIQERIEELNLMLEDISVLIEDEKIKKLAHYLNSNFLKDISEASISIVTTSDTINQTVSLTTASKERINSKIEQIPIETTEADRCTEIEAYASVMGHDVPTPTESMPLDMPPI